MSATKLVSDVAYFKPPDPRVQMAVRIEASVKRKIDGLVRCWQALAKARDEDPDEIDQAYVVRALLTSAVEGAVVELTDNGKMKWPETDAEMAQFVADLSKAAKRVAGR